MCGLVVWFIRVGFGLLRFRVWVWVVGLGVWLVCLWVDCFGLVWFVVLGCGFCVFCGLGVDWCVVCFVRVWVGCWWCGFGVLGGVGVWCFVGDLVGVCWLVVYLFFGLKFCGVGFLCCVCYLGGCVGVWLRVVFCWFGLMLAVLDLLDYYLVWLCCVVCCLGFGRFVMWWFVLLFAWFEFVGGLFSCLI